MIRAVLFDLDDTLVESGATHHEAGARAFGTFGIDYAEATRRTGSTVGMRVRDAYELRRAAMGTGEAEAPMEELFALRERFFVELLPERVKVLPGATEALELVSTAGLPCGVVSSSSRNCVTAMLDYFGLGGFFEVQVCGDEVQQGKPDPECYERAFGALAGPRGISLAGCLVIEDSQPGVIAARAAGLPVCWVPLGQAQPVTEAEYRLASLTEFPALLDRLIRA